MTTRFNVDVQNGLQSGYNNHGRAENFTIPSCGIEDVDRALFNLFDKEIPLLVSTGDKVSRPGVIFAAGEKWVMMKKKKALHDHNGRLILPLITIGRTKIEQNIRDDITGRGINQQTGELKIKRRLMNTDRSYQNLLNRLFVNNQSNVAINPNGRDVNLNGQLMSDNAIGDLFQHDPDVEDGALLKPFKDENVWETLTIPAPQFFSAHYDITIWTQYTQHMNQLLETLIAAQLPQGNAYRISNPLKNGYWFVAKTNENIYTAQNNFDDMFEKDRIIKYEFAMTVPGFIIATDVPGAPVPIRRYVSSTRIEFNTNISGIGGVDVDDETNTIVDPWLGADDPTLPYEHVMPSRLQRDDARADGANRLDRKDKVSPNDPALKAYKRGTQPDRYVKVRTVDREGNTTYKNVKLRNINKITGESVVKSSDFSLDGVSFSVEK